MRGRREHRQAEAHQPVSAHLQHQGRQHHRTGRRRFHVCVRQPRVQREQRHFNRERDEECEEEERLFIVREHHFAARDAAENARVIEGARAIEDEDDRDQHQRGTGKRIQEELERGVDAAIVSPDADEEVHGDENDFPEHVEQEQVPRGEDADESALEQQQERVVFFGAVFDGVPREQDRDGGEEAWKG